MEDDKAEVGMFKLFLYVIARYVGYTFYIIYNMFRSAAIVQGVYKRGLDGNASSEAALEYAGKPRLRAERGWALVSQWDR